MLITLLCIIPYEIGAVLRHTILIFVTLAQNYIFEFVLGLLQRVEATKRNLQPLKTKMNVAPLDQGPCCRKNEIVKVPNHNH